MTNQVLNGIMGGCVADALGLPVEFQDRDVLDQQPVLGMRAYGTFHQPAGTWSDDTSMTICLVDSLLHGLDYFGVMNHFRKWMFKGEYTPFGKSFDVGNCTAKAVFRYDRGQEPLSCGGTTEGDNGNGSLMRILPLAYYLPSVYGSEWFGNDEAMTIIHNISKLTHGHKRCWIACGIYLSIADLLADAKDLPKGHSKGLSKDLPEWIEQGLERAVDYYQQRAAYEVDLIYFERLRGKSFAGLPVESIRSSGYVVDTLEAAVWCLLNTHSYAECVLRAVNLGGDTDTVAAVAGGLAGIYYGYDSIPEDWLAVIARREYVEDLCVRFSQIGTEKVIGAKTIRENAFELAL